MTSLIRNPCWMGSLLLVSAAGMAGCQVAQPRPMDRVDTTPIVTDDAMRARPWTESTASYPNLSVTTYSCECYLEPANNAPPAVRAAGEVPVFLADILLTPIPASQHPFWEQVESTSFYLPPSYTDNPPLTPVDHNDFSGGPGGSPYNAAPGRVTTNAKAGKTH